MTESAKKKWKVVLCVVGGLLLLFGIYWFILRPKVDWDLVKRYISEEVNRWVDYNGDKANAEQVILQGVKEIVNDRELFAQAKVYVGDSGVPIERIVVDSAIIMASNLKYI